MNWRNFKLLIIGGGLCLVLLIAAIVLLVMFGQQHAKANQDLKSSLDSLKRLKAAQVYPSQDNAEVLRKNIEELVQFKADYQAELGSAQIEPIENMSRTKFMAYFEEVRRDLQQEAEREDEEAGKEPIELPEKFGFGFQGYLSGVGPKQSSVPRLTVQLQSVEAICRILFEQGIKALSEVEREAFEAGQSSEDEEMMAMMEMEAYGGPPVDRSAKGTDAPAAEENSHLYSRDCFTITFQADEATTWRVIDAFSSDATPLLIHDVELENMNKALQPKLTSASAVRGRTSSSRRSTRSARTRSSRSRVPMLPGEMAGMDMMEEAEVVAGEELVKTTLKVCAYRFGQDSSDAEAAE